MHSSGEEAVQTVGVWMREQDAISSDINNIFVGAQQNSADRVLWSNKFEHHTEGSAHDRDRYASVNPRHPTFSSR
jgi:hypothetical protein